jgi:hypothetical protein
VLQKAGKSSPKLIDDSEYCQYKLFCSLTAAEVAFIMQPYA